MKNASRYKSAKKIALALGLPESRGLEATMKTQITKAIIKEIERQRLTHQEVANLADVSRTTVTGIVNGSLQRITLDRLLRILGAIGLGIEIRVKKAS